VKQLADMTTNELIDYWSGYLLIEIGRGKFRDGVCMMLLSTMQESRNQFETEKKAKKEKR
jgi:hypothetical protein